jgi:hypothetical protein
MNLTFQLTDYGSIMHYRSMAFSKDVSSGAPRVLQAVDIVNGNRVPNQANTDKMGQRKGLSAIDAIDLVSGCTIATLGNAPVLIARGIACFFFFFLRNRGYQLYIYLHIFYFKL